ncbi:Endoplasmic reticulum-Golgi intermediate compartment protein 1 [Tupaia chinensis]|uniref:Endoplasmic reticulum-Golgi intermediate compartment protein n=1 Tax=Tupaia chinensis TaxID=246437 RepID=L9JCF9_TUPCH|nr:Endoplasmic reticulum-Golgi intermediate compartment protein 1 [Tupaia chinensis]
MRAVSRFKDEERVAYEKLMGKARAQPGRLAGPWSDRPLQLHASPADPVVDGSLPVATLPCPSSQTSKRRALPQAHTPPSPEPSAGGTFLVFTQRGPARSSRSWERRGLRMRGEESDSAAGRGSVLGCVLRGGLEGLSQESWAMLIPLQLSGLGPSRGFSHPHLQTACLVGFETACLVGFEVGCDEIRSPHPEPLPRAGPIPGHDPPLLFTFPWRELRDLTTPSGRRDQERGLAVRSGTEHSWAQNPCATIGQCQGLLPEAVVRVGDPRRFDIYRKVPKDLTQPTYTGAIISICCCLFILFLFLSELTGFITTEVEIGMTCTQHSAQVLKVRQCESSAVFTPAAMGPTLSPRPSPAVPSHFQALPAKASPGRALHGSRQPSLHRLYLVAVCWLRSVNELYVDDPDKDSGGKIDVSLNISLPNLHCELVGLDIQDEMGRHEVGHIDNSMKIPLSNGAGCRFEGQFSINKVPGNFHVSTHSATAQPQNPDMTHVIHKLSFGDTLQVQNVHGAFNALGGADRLTSNRTYPAARPLLRVPGLVGGLWGQAEGRVLAKLSLQARHADTLLPASWNPCQGGAPHHLPSSSGTSLPCMLRTPLSMSRAILTSRALDSSDPPGVAAAMLSDCSVCSPVTGTVTRPSPLLRPASCPSFGLDYRLGLGSVRVCCYPVWRGRSHAFPVQDGAPDGRTLLASWSPGREGAAGICWWMGGAKRVWALASHDYILKIVPTVYEDKSGKQRYSYQYTVANKEYVAYSHTGRIIPAIWFRYDLSPITVKYTERRQPLYRFITTICAIIGGTFTVAGILDSCIFTASEAWKKVQLGKMH